MKRFIFVGLLLLTACASQPAAAPAETAAPTVEPAFAQAPGVVIASAEVEPGQVSQLSFTVSAVVGEIPVNEGDAVKAGDTLMVLNMPEIEYNVLAAEADYKARSQAAELQRAEKVLYVDPNTGRKSWYSLPREVYLKALAQADVAKAQWDAALANLAQATLGAPFDGTVADVAVVPGELVQPNQVVITLADLEHMQIVTTDLSERDIARVKIGQTATVVIEALGISVSGKVVRISPIAENVGGDVVYPVTIELDEQPEGLMWGMSAEVEVEVGEE
ncbi:MAG: efflux RND transporter periplasmic adaptor subunit [Anaerolineales bacterium]|jgi:RND family efflux transporter MFP subunit|nr:efflux RND transporter periplasmic adaptor subunit [Anaerolineales bacterium]